MVSVAEISVFYLKIGVLNPETCSTTREFQYIQQMVFH